MNKLPHRLLVGTAAFAAVMIVASLMNVELDVTPDQRHTLNQSLKDQLVQTEPLVITVLLDESVPRSFSTYRTYIDRILARARRYQPLIQIEYKNPNEGPPDEVAAFRKFLGSRGVEPLSRQVQSQDEVSQSLLYPFVSLQTVDELLFVDILEPRLLTESEESTLLRSQFSFESKLVRALRSLNQNRLDQVAVLGPKSALIAEGFNRDSRISGRKYVNASDGSLLELYTSLDAIIVVTNRDLPRDELVAIDALASSGVPVVWCVDKFSVTLDSLSDGPYLATTGQLNLDDYLFNYGVKIEPELIQDLSCHTIPQVVGSQGGTAATESLPYPYHLRVVGFDQGSVLNRFVGEMHIPYASPISVRDNQELLKIEPILFSSPNSKTTPSPAILDFGLMTKALEEADFGVERLPVGVQLKGIFDPYFGDLRLTDEEQAFRKTIRYDGSRSTTQIVISDAQFVTPPQDRNGRYWPAGYNIWDRQMYDANVLWMDQVLESIIHGDEVIRLRQRRMDVSLVDRSKWRTNINSAIIQILVLPIAMVIGLYLLTYLYRRHRYGRA